MAVTEKTFSAVIFGGCTTSFDVNPDTLSGDIAAGEYRIVVSAVSGDADIASADAKLTVGVVADKMLTRFSPADHQAKYTAFANKNNYRIYLDYFPGYWPLAKDSDGKYIYYEIVGRWRLMIPSNIKVAMCIRYCITWIIIAAPRRKLKSAILPLLVILIPHAYTIITMTLANRQ